MTVLKSKKVDIEIENRDGEYTEESFLVRRLRFDKMTAALEEVHAIYDVVAEDEKLQGLFGEIFGQEDGIDPEIWDNFSEEEKKEVALQRRADAEKRFLNGVLGSFNVLLVHLPVKAGDLLATMAQMDRDLLGQQELETIMDIYDAVLKVNDLETLYERAKKSLAVTKTAMSWLNLRREATDMIKH